MPASSDICERMEVVDVNGRHVGFVEAATGDAIRLVRDDPDPGAPRHHIPLVWVAGVGQTVRLDRALDPVTREPIG